MNRDDIARLRADLPAPVRAAADAAVDAHARFAAALDLPTRRERTDARRVAVNDLAAANRVLAAHHPDLVGDITRAALAGGAR